VEVPHEALLRQWAPLREAIDRSRTSLRLLADLTRAAADWEANHRDPAYLLRGARLATADEWLDGGSAELDASTRDLVVASRALAAGELSATRRSNRKLRILAGALTLLLVVALGVGGLAVQQRSQAREQASLTLGRQLLAQAALVPADQPDLALLLQVERTARFACGTPSPARSGENPSRVIPDRCGRSSSARTVGRSRRSARRARGCGMPPAARWSATRAW
jgi:hypothetical protein